MTTETAVVAEQLRNHEKDCSKRYEEFVQRFQHLETQQNILVVLTGGTLSAVIAALIIQILK